MCIRDRLGVFGAVGSRNTCAVLASGGVQCWGRSSNGSIGDGVDRSDDLTQPTTNVSIIAASLALDEEVEGQTVLLNELFAFTPRIVGITDSWSVIGAPDWASFNTLTGTLYGVVTSTRDAENITISVGSVDYGPFAIAVQELEVVRLYLKLFLEGPL